MRGFPNKFRALLMAVVALALAVSITPACAASKIALDAGQSAVEPYSVAVVGKTDGVLAANSKFIAIDAEVAGKVQVWGPPPGDPFGVPVVHKEWVFEHATGRRVYQLIFTGDKRVVEIVPSSWEAARVSIRYLPE